MHRDPEYTGQLAGVAAAFRGLPEADRELLALVAWEGLDNGQVADVLGCSRNAVRIRLHRARARLADAMAQQSARSWPAACPGREWRHSMNDIDLIGALSAISDEDADRLISDGVAADLACRITAMPAGQRAREPASRTRSAIGAAGWSGLRSPSAWPPRCSWPC